jgi:hypothetical protein
VTLTTAQRAALIATVADAIQASVTMWEEGRMTSPSSLDFVIDARRVLHRDLPGFIGTTPEGEEFVADVLAEDCGETYVTNEDIATYLVDTLTAE